MVNTKLFPHMKKL